MIVALVLLAYAGRLALVGPRLLARRSWTDRALRQIGTATLAPGRSKTLPDGVQVRFDGYPIA